MALIKRALAVDHTDDIMSFLGAGFSTREHPCASKDYACGRCGRGISKGHYYSRSVGREKPGVPRILCIRCAQLMGERPYTSPSGEQKYQISN